MKLFDITPVGAFGKAIDAAAESESRSRRHDHRTAQKPPRSTAVYQNLLGRYRRHLLAAISVTKAKDVPAA